MQKCKIIIKKKELQVFSGFSGAELNAVFLVAYSLITPNQAKCVWCNSTHVTADPFLDLWNYNNEAQHPKKPAGCIKWLA